jgi:glycosyltransferase involved in cell wall biosynthesis
VSSHEGLGLGFFESVSVATPVISLDLPPHNEVVQVGASGWLLPVKAFKLVDNMEALVEGGLFEVADLAKVIEDISSEDIAMMTLSTARLHNAGFSEPDMAVRLAAALTAE